MANKHRGEVELEVDGQTWTLRYSANALCELEDALNLGVAEIVETLQNPKGVRIKTLRALLWAGLRDRHPEMTLAMAGDLLTATGVPTAFEHVGQAIGRAFPQAKEARGDERPRGGIEGGTSKRS